MAKSLLTDALWERIDPLLPPYVPSPRGGRPPTPDRVALEGILFVLKSGIDWEDLPAPFGCCGMTCWRRLRDWQAAGVWQALHEMLLAELREADQIDFARAIVDSASVRALKGGRKPGRTPRIAVKMAPSITSSRTPVASHWRARSRARTNTMSRN